MAAKKINPEFGQFLAEKRAAAGLTQQGLAQKSGVPLGSLREFEQGRREPLFSNMQKLAAALGASGRADAVNPAAAASNKTSMAFFTRASTK